MFDQTHAAIVARSDERVVLSVSRVGDIAKILSVGDNMYPLGVSNGSLWIATFQPGEGIESPPQGPSDLIRVQGNGATSTVATDPHVIVSALSGTNDNVAYVASAFFTRRFALRPRPRNHGRKIGHRSALGPDRRSGLVVGHGLLM